MLQTAEAGAENKDKPKMFQNISKYNLYNIYIIRSK